MNEIQQIYMNIGKRIRNIRKSKKMTQEYLSELTGIGTPSISKIEIGMYHPTDENLEKIAHALEVEPYKLYMVNHHKDPKELKNEIISMLDKATDDEIKLAYRILNGFLN